MKCLLLFKRKCSIVCRMWGTGEWFRWKCCCLVPICPIDSRTILVEKHLLNALNNAEWLDYANVLLAVEQPKTSLSRWNGMQNAAVEVKSSFDNQEGREAVIHKACHSYGGSDSMVASSPTALLLPNDFRKSIQHFHRHKRRSNGSSKALFSKRGFLCFQHSEIDRFFWGNFVLVEANIIFLVPVFVRAFK